MQSPCLLYIWTFVVLFLLHYVHIFCLRCMFYFGPHSGKNESSVNALYTYEAPGRPEVSIYARTCVCHTVLQLLSGPQRPRMTAQGSQTLRHLSPSASFSLSSTFLVSLRFTLCPHPTLWVVLSYYLEFSWAPLSGICLLLRCKKMSLAMRRICAMSTLRHRK